MTDGFWAEYKAANHVNGSANIRLRGCCPLRNLEKLLSKHHLLISLHKKRSLIKCPFSISWSVSDLLINAEKCLSEWNDPNLALAVQLLSLSSHGLLAVLAAQQAPTWSLRSLTCYSLPPLRTNCARLCHEHWGTFHVTCWVLEWGQSTRRSLLIELHWAWSPAAHGWWQIPQAAEPGVWCCGLGDETWGQHMLLLPRDSESRDNYMGDQDWRVWPSPASLSAIFKRPCARKALPCCPTRACFSLPRFLLSAPFPQ